MDQALWWISIAAGAVALGAIVSRGLHRNLPTFAIYLTVNLAADLLLKLIPGPTTRPYAIAWMISKPVILILWVLLVLELLRKIQGHYPGMGTFARTLLIFALSVVSIAAVLTLAADVRGIRWQQPAVQLIVLLNRWIATILAALLFFVIGFLRYYRSPMKPNLLWHTCILAAYFSLQAAAMFLTNLVGAIVESTIPSRFFGTDAITQINRALLIGHIACSFCWAMLLTRNGEGVPMSPTLSAKDLEMIERRDRELLDIVRWLLK